MNSKDSLEMSVMRAFRRWPMPIGVERSLQDTYRDDECVRLCRQILLKKWNGILPEHLWSSVGGLVFLSDNEFQYILPSCLVSVLREQCDLMFIQWFVNRVASPWPKGDDPRFGFDVLALSSDQISVLCCVLNEIATYGSIAGTRMTLRIHRMVEYLAAH